ncbi:MAG: FtsW/RodA/SpoVE family cell cycle protein [Ardenticatenales bacterium]|nr:FtsW/RodA/SpoVE family cell cycle protein [Ardenticatenales bacterium]
MTATAKLQNPEPTAGTLAVGFRWRAREFFLLLFPVALTALGFYVLQQLEGRVDVERYWPAIVLGVAALVMHLILCWKAPDADEMLLPITLMMNGMGLVMIERLASNFTVRQTSSMIIGMLVCLALTLWNEGPRYAERYRYTLILPGILLLTVGLVLSFVGEGPGRSVLAITDRFGIQPSEPLKLLLVLFLAGFLDFHREKFATVRLTHPFQDRRWLWVFIPLLGMWGISMLLLILQRDLGAALLFFTIFLVLAYLATQRIDYVALSLGFFMLGAFVAYQALSYVATRFEVWLDPWSFNQGAGYQLIQALLAVAHGGVFGQGLGQGFPGFVPVVHSDFILAAIGEEWGLAGILAVIGLYLIFLLRGFYVAMRAPDSFEQLVAAGLTALLCMQALIIMAGSLKLVPLTGITLPFISYGGTSLMTSYALLGMVLRISRDRNLEPV